MKLLLDTHLLVWLASDRTQLDRRERLAIESNPDDLILSVVNIWELRLKWRSNPVRAAADGLITPGDALQFAGHRSIDIAPLTAADVATVLDPPLEHGDSFDEMLLIHAQRLDARLLTRDSKLLGHPLAYSL